MPTAVRWPQELHPDPEGGSAMSTFAQTFRHTVERHPALTKVLLGCGIVGPAWWVGMDVVGSLRYPGYSYVDQTISELSAQGAPTKTFMLIFSGIPYLVLMLAFGVGIWVTAGESRAGRITAALVLGEVVWGVAGGLAFPMAMRGHEETLRNQMHGWYGIGMPIFFLLAVAFGSRLFGKRFRYYSYGTVLVLLVFGALTAMQAPKVPANEPTPWIGVEERINAYLPMLWFVVLAFGLLRESARVPRRLEQPTVTPQRLQQVAH
jgi:hypothetical protein